MGSSYISLIALKESEKNKRTKTRPNKKEKRKKELCYLHLNKGGKIKNKIVGQI